ncbi:CDP-alcohol phosphatidyltransferase family protein [Qingshengfaniella alkalisoli]|uniref:CDP-alcohol phosphatidyltransferase family protein n=1 Tax=Qingshengfaniella alkalisoli TaxID=2599296 RepID=UPI00143D1C90|nr:CDP-alcohol phosphatidyltransferase family protein [Qingshengfaniella alkalisoli]
MTVEPNRSLLDFPATVERRVLATAAVTSLLLAIVVTVGGAVVGVHTQIPSALPLLLLGVWTIGSVAVFLGLRSYPHGRFGPANVVTSVRAGGVVVLSSVAIDPSIMDQIGRLMVAGLAVFLLALDGLDGFLARRTGLVSAFGARFDMEVDALLTLVLSLVLWRTGIVASVVLFLILPYYLFCITKRSLPWLSGPLPPSFRRKTICVVQIALPICLLAIPLPKPVPTVAVAIVLMVILWSFVRDIHRLWSVRT